MMRSSDSGPNDEKRIKRVVVREARITHDANFQSSASSELSVLTSGSGMAL